MQDSEVRDRRGLDRLHTNARFLKETISYTILPPEEEGLSADEIEKRTLVGRISRGAMLAYTATVDAADDNGYVYDVLEALAERGVLGRTTFARYFLELQRGRPPFVLRVPATRTKNGGPRPRFEVLVLPIDSRPDSIRLRLRRPMPPPNAPWTELR